MGKVVEHFLGLSGPYLQISKDDSGKPTGEQCVKCELVYAGGKFRVIASAAFELIQHTTGRALKHLPSGKILLSDTPFTAVMDSPITEGVFFRKYTKGAFLPHTLLDIQVDSKEKENTQPSLKMEVKK